jgi:RsiW-degrading membrane proteinase PrsW (M82 family)
MPSSTFPQAHLYLLTQPRHNSPAETLRERGDLSYHLSPVQDTYLGRSPDCQVVLSLTYRLQRPVVSRHHAVIQPVLGPGDRHWSWQISDLHSANGTYVNGQRIHKSYLLQAGDEIQLGQTGPCFRFETDTLLTAQAPTSPTLSQSLQHLFPILSTGKQLLQQAPLIPGLVTISLVISLFFAFGNSLSFNLLLAIYLAFAGYYFFIYRLCRKPKPWWLLLGTAGFTALVISSPVLDLFSAIFRQWLPGALPESHQAWGLGSRFGSFFWGTGLMEELIKILPVLGLWGLGYWLPAPWHRRVGVWEPLDGIVLGAASAVGFTLVETLGQYVPQVTQTIALESGAIAGELAGLQLLIPRLLGAIVGHMAYSGYFGYFIGLSALQSGQRWRTLAIGYFSAALLHTLWNVAGAIGGLGLALSGLLSYALLMAAILKAQDLSPQSRLPG